MAYPTIYGECWDGDHEACERRGRDLPEIPSDVEICGGGFCVCECHWEGKELNQAWIDEVREMVRRSKCSLDHHALGLLVNRCPECGWKIGR